ncbi:histidine kinase [Devosia soli]|uniref:Blue-light-activated histidine kinase n=1 Tax=Devosia soli TaxID=361041 RepID=A0A0F5LFW0_9HYPH|nr:PAS domain-containing protein [Devosia soli]KKB80477.1 histidine kinase [Devosia soli]
MPDFTEEARIVRELLRAGNGPDPFSSAVRTTRMPMVITDPRQPDNPIVFVNAAFALLTGYGRSEIIGKNCRFLQGPDTDLADVARLREAIRAREAIELDLLNYKKDGTRFWNRLLVSPVFGDDGQLTYFFASQLDVTLERERLVQLQRDRDALEIEVDRRSAELQASEQRLRIALSAGKLGIWTINLQTMELTASDICKQICGRTPEEPLSLEELRASIHPDDRVVHFEAIDSAIADGSLLDAEYRLFWPSGEMRWVQIRGQASYAEDGTPMFLTGTTQDITERREAQAQRALLARELSHRVKNTLASLQAIATQTLRRATSLQDANMVLSARIQAMAAATDLLISEDFGDPTLRALIERTLAPFGIDDRQRFDLNGPDLSLPHRSVSAFALALHELATNATKYGALSKDGGRVHVDWSKDDMGLMRLVWREIGGPAVEAPTKTSFGTQLIQRLLSAETGGSAEIIFDPGGIVFIATTRLDDNED